MSRQSPGQVRRLLRPFAISVALAIAVLGLSEPVSHGAADASAATGTATATTTPTQLFPNLKTLPPRDMRFDRTDTSVDGSGVMENVLRFTNTVMNVGEGKLTMYSQIDPTTTSGTAYQRVYDTAGGYTDYNVGTMYYHPVHNHYHYDNWGNYQLWTKADYDSWVATGRGTPPPGAVKKVGTKTTSCVMDEEFQQTLPGTPYPGQYPYAGCNPGSSGKLEEGLSPGWGDTYDYYRYEQWFDLGQSTLADGDYVIRSVSDPTNKIYESTNKADSTREGEQDNEATTTIRVSGGKLVDLSNPTGTIAVNHVDPTTTSPTVSVDVYGRDDVSGVDTFQLSNDGKTWSTPFSSTSVDSTPTTVNWNLSDASTGGTTAGGVKTVYARMHDRAGHYSTVDITDTITYAPGGTAPPPTDTYGKAVMADGPSGFWRLDETSGTTAADSGGTAAGTYRNGVTLNQPSLVSSTTDPSSRFDGVNDSVNIPFSTGVDASTAVSVEAWIKPSVLPAAGQWATVATKPESFSLQFYGDQVEFTIIQNGVRQRMRAPSGTITAGQTYHLVGTYDGNQEKLYVNGKLVPTKNLTGAISQNPNAFNIGSWDGSSEFFNGWIDDVAVYKKALSSSQVNAHYAAAGTSTSTPTPTPTPTPTGYAGAVLTDGATGYWRLGEASGTTAANRVSGAPAGTYLNGATLGQPSLLTGDTTDTSTRFDGVNDSVNIPFNSGVDASTAVSVEAWIKPSALPAAGQWATVATKPESFSLQFYGDQIEFTIIQNGVRQRMRAPSGTITAGQTYHVIGTYDGNQEKLYVNGKQIPARSQTGLISQNPNSFNIGSWDGSSEFFNGLIDEVAVYKNALTQTQVNNHYALGKP